ncbi:hypothetical protein, partial [Maritalea sp.]|uniref:hypothetical protein n=1 Tax=Maritalea sp. TaxID=2003361 RepID=UPI003EF347FE
PTVATELNFHVFELVKNSNFKKTEFALAILSSDDWNVPLYIAEGLTWLEQRLQTQLAEEIPA